MRESHLLLISLIVSVIGLVSLFFISESIDITDTTIEKITNGEIEGDVSLKGVVKSINMGDKYTSLVLTQNNDVEVIGFSKINLKEGDRISVVGRFEEGKIIADKIELTG